MKIMVILCHPMSASFNHSVAERAVTTLKHSHHTIYFHDLYREGFDPVLTSADLERRFSFDEQVLSYAEQLEEAQGLVICHPDWWCGPPALLKGWVDRVLLPGFAYEFVGEEFMPKRKTPLLTGKKALVFYTTNQQEGKHTRLIEELWINEILGYCGMEEAACYVIPSLYKISPAQRKTWLDTVEETLKSWFPADPEWR
jgi:putative NADPH-quinone reductase